MPTAQKPLQLRWHYNHLHVFCEKTLCIIMMTLCLACIVGTTVTEYDVEQIDKRAADRAPSNVLSPGIHTYAGQRTRVGWTRQTLSVFVWAISLPSPYTDKSYGRGCLTFQDNSVCNIFDHSRGVEYSRIHGAPQTADALGDTR